MPSKASIPWPDEAPIAAGKYFTDAPAWWCAMVKRITGKPYAHVGDWYEWPGGLRLRVEALTDGLVRERGIAGPLTWESLEQFARQPRCRAVWCTLSMDRAAVAAMYHEARTLQRFASYSELRLLALWVEERARKWLGMEMPPQKDSPSRLVCSGFSGWTAEAGGYPMTDAKRKRKNQLTPGSIADVCVARYGCKLHEIRPPLQRWPRNTEVAP